MKKEAEKKLLKVIKRVVIVEVIVDVDTGKTIDLFSPYWYYESS